MQTHICTFLTSQYLVIATLLLCLIRFHLLLLRLLQRAVKLQTENLGRALKLHATVCPPAIRALQVQLESMRLLRSHCCALSHSLVYVSFPIESYGELQQMMNKF